MSKKCVLDENKICDDCGECDYCDLNPFKICDNCGRCIDSNDEYREVKIDELDLDTEAHEHDCSCGCHSEDE